MSGERWTDTERDLVYSELCEAITRAGPDHEALFLSRLSLLLIERLGSHALARQALLDAEHGLRDTNEPQRP